MVKKEEMRAAVMGLLMSFLVFCGCPKQSRSLLHLSSPLSPQDNTRESINQNVAQLLQKMGFRSN